MTAQQFPYVYLKNLDETEKIFTHSTDDNLYEISPDKHITGVFFDVLKSLQKDMNFTSTLWRRQDGHWGRFINGTWTGMINNLIEGDADLALASLTITDQRFSVVDFGPPIGKETFCLLVARGNKNFEERAWLSFFYPFTNRLWLLLGLNFVVLLTSIKIITTFYKTRSVYLALRSNPVITNPDIPGALNEF